MKAMLHLSACGLALLMGAPLAAQEADEEQAPDADEIIVTGKGLDPALSTGIYATTTIERETIVASASGRIEDVLRNVAGFQQFRRSDSRSSNPSAQGATLRALGGNATSRTLVLLDGVPLAPFAAYRVALAGALAAALSGILAALYYGNISFGTGMIYGLKILFVTAAGSYSSPPRAAC